jgi:hypothetical protein
MHTSTIRRAAAGAAIALAGLCAGVSPALAAPVSDGTSNTIQLAVSAPAIDQAHHRVVVTAPGAAAVLRPGKHLDDVQLVRASIKYTFQDVMVESLTGPTASQLSLNFTKVEFKNTMLGCTAAADACLIEQEGLYPPAA